MLIHLAGLILLVTGGLLEVTGTSFWGLDALVGLCFACATVAGGVSALAGRRAAWGLVVTAVGAAALVLHVWLNVAS
jgi:hypothetical protein